MGPCNTEGVFCMSALSERKNPTDQPLHWFSGVVTVLETLDFSIRKLVFTLFCETQGMDRPCRPCMSVVWVCF